MYCAVNRRSSLTVRGDMLWRGVAPEVKKEGGEHNSITCYEQLPTVHLQCTQYKQVKWPKSIEIRMQMILYLQMETIFTR
jgi:hypothetical protein